MSRIVQRAFPGALLLGGVLGNFSFAQSQASVLNWTPAIELTRPDSQTLQVWGAPGERLFLLYGALEAGSETCGRRVDAKHILEVQLDPTGHKTLLGQVVGSRMFVQAWQPGVAAAGPWGAFSAPVTLQIGGLSLASVAAPGDLLVTEFMKDPTVVADTHGEWIEIMSTKAWRLDIEGVTLSDISGASFTLNNGGNGIMLAPGERFVLGNDDDPLTNGGVPVDWKWTGFSLKNTDDEIILTSASGVYIDVVLYDDGVRWPDTPGMSISLSNLVQDSFTNDTPDLWCHGSSTIGAGPDLGTPRMLNDLCP